MLRVTEYIIFVFLGTARLTKAPEGTTGHKRSAKNTKLWFNLLRYGADGYREKSPGCFYPIFLRDDGSVYGVGEVLPLGQNEISEEAPPGTRAIWPIHADGTQARWSMRPSELQKLINRGMVQEGRPDRGRRSIMYLRRGTIKAIDQGEISTSGFDDRGVLQIVAPESNTEWARSQWNNKSHEAGVYGTLLNSALLPGRRFPFPKSLYAVEDTLRFIVQDKPYATILDFFAGSGTTAHAVMRLNKQDGGKRQSISITNNEVSADEQAALRAEGHRPGDPEWEALGICDYITKPRIAAAITGIAANGKPIEEDYAFNDEFPMSDGLEANAAFFTLTYENSLTVAYHKAFKEVAPLFWLRAGSEGRMIDQIPEKGWDAADTYAIIEDLDRASEFTEAIVENERIKIAYIVTDDDRRFQMICGRLPSSVKPVRLYQSYLLNFQLNNGRGVA